MCVRETVNLYVVVCEIDYMDICACTCVCVCVWCVCVCVCVYR